ncbi:hypothetical protein F4775DRAFT_552168 [Biscogniauxia sp. FL1348]|nr:hypothetical protein F4775DRAFT_552168 [Biscogniauxia sp. FL1348]
MHFSTAFRAFLLFPITHVLGGPIAHVSRQNQTSTQQQCTEETAIQRKEWSSMTEFERLAFVSAVECLMNQPPEWDVPGSTSAYDDFVATHIRVTTSVHLNGVFLSWHRHFEHLLEGQLHDKCSYPGYLGLPYWDYPLYLDKPLNQSLLFDGTPDSLGSDGTFIPNREDIVVTPEWDANLQFPHGPTLPRGAGGDCTYTGPFANSTVSFGPIPRSVIPTGLPANWTQPNPHCLVRDLNDWFLRRLNNATAIENLLASEDILQFQTRLEPIHQGGHLTIGGAMQDFFTSPQDPIFWLHHTNLDRLWSIWQAEDPARRSQFNGTSTYLNPIGYTPEVDIDTQITFPVLGENITLGDASNPMAGRYCYVYV